MSHLDSRVPSSVRVLFAIHVDGVADEVDSRESVLLPTPSQYVGLPELLVDVRLT
jgi:hypothetical protein